MEYTLKTLHPNMGMLKGFKDELTVTIDETTDIEQLYIDNSFYAGTKDTLEVRMCKGGYSIYGGRDGKAIAMLIRK